MDILETLVAFSLLMIVFSTIVSSLVEFAHRFTNQREAGFRRLIDRLYDDLYARILVSDAKTASSECKAAFLRTIVENRGIPDRSSVGEGGFLERLWSVLRWTVPRDVAKLSTVEFMRRLAETDVGREIAKQGDEMIDRMAGEVARRFEEFGAQTRAYFRQRAYAISIVLSVALAFFANIDAVGLFNALREDAALRDSITAQAEQTVAAMQAQEAATAKARAGDKPLSPEELKKLRDEVAEKFAELRRQSAVLPIGYDMFPGCLADDRDPRCASVDAKTKDAHAACGPAVACRLGAAFAGDFGMVAKWFVSVLAAGMLIGLGGPFWFNVYTNLSRVLGIARSVVGRKPEAQEQKKPPEDGVVTARETTPEKAFREAASVLRPPAPRRILGPEGEPL